MKRVAQRATLEGDRGQLACLRGFPRPVLSGVCFEGSLMGNGERELRAAQNQMMFRSVNDRIQELGENQGGSPLEFACECADDTCIERIPLAAHQFLAIESEPNRFIVLRGHEVPEVEDVIAERDGFLIVSKRGAGAEFVKEHSSSAPVMDPAGGPLP
jgi:hypothetical protein